MHSPFRGAGRQPPRKDAEVRKPLDRLHPKYKTASQYACQRHSDVRDLHHKRHINFTSEAMPFLSRPPGWPEIGKQKHLEKNSLRQYKLQIIEKINYHEITEKMVKGKIYDE